MGISWNGGTPFHHPFFSGIVREKPSSYCSNPHDELETAKFLGFQRSPCCQKNCRPQSGRFVAWKDLIGERQTATSTDVFQPRP